MRVKELFIQNETYQLPSADYDKFKQRLDKCSKNPMCINNLKYDAETYIAKYARSHASKIENGDESGFIVESAIGDMVTKSDGSKQIDYIKLAGLAILMILIIMAIKERSIEYGLAALAVGAFSFYNAKK